MKYPLNILKSKLKEVEIAQKLCLKNDNYTDYGYLEKNKAIPLRVSISLIEMAVENELKFNVIIK